MVKPCGRFRIRCFSKLGDDSLSKAGRLRGEQAGKANGFLGIIAQDFTAEIVLI